MFKRTAYVAYTATPFANVLIDPSAYDREVAGGLYPRDFIFSLPKQPHYIGAERLFGREAFGDEAAPRTGLDVVRTIPDSDLASLLPPARREAGQSFRPTLCSSLESAITDFVLSTAAKEHRLGRGPATMLIHTSQRTGLHNALRPLVDEYLALLRRRWKYDRRTFRAALEGRWKSDFQTTTLGIDADRSVPFGDIEDYIDRFFNYQPDVRVLNMTSGDRLDYDADPNLRTIVIGGNLLSRGLTLEHLLVSYYIRRASNYDTLMQMGRWFGYRKDYVDLTRLWTTNELHGRFRHLSLVEEEFRDQLELYSRHNMTPADFGPRIRTHPGMAVTAARKMGSGRTVRLSFAGQLRQTSRFHLNDVDKLRSNLEATREFLRAIGTPTRGSVHKPEWTGVEWRQVVGYLEKYASAHTPDVFDSKALADYVRRQAERHSELIQWHISVRGINRRRERLGAEDLGVRCWEPINLASRSQLLDDPGSVGVLTDPPDMELGLNRTQLEEANRRGQNGEFRARQTALISVREPTNGLLLIYPVSRESRPEQGSTARRPLFDAPEKACTVIGVALVLPLSNSNATVEYMVGANWRDGDE